MRNGKNDVLVKSLKRLFSVIPAPIFIGMNSSRNPVLNGSLYSQGRSLDSRSPIVVEDKFHENDIFIHWAIVVIPEAGIQYL